MAPREVKKSEHYCTDKIGRRRNTMLRAERADGWSSSSVDVRRKFLGQNWHCGNARSHESGELYMTPSWAD